MKKSNIVFNLMILLFFAFCLMMPEKVSAEEKELPPGITKKDEIPGEGLHKGWEQGQHKGWDKDKTESPDKAVKKSKAKKKAKGKDKGTEETTEGQQQDKDRDRDRDNGEIKEDESFEKEEAGVVKKQQKESLGRSGMKSTSPKGKGRGK